MKTGLFTVSLVTLLQKIPMIVLAIITMLIAYQLAQLTWALVPEDKPVLSWKPVPVTNSQNRERISTQKLIQQNLFGKKSKQVKPAVQQKSITDAPKTRLKLKLVGIVAATEPEFSSVIIEYKGNQNSYFMNSKIDGTRAEITQIYPDRIILEVDASQQTLMLDGADNAGKQTINKKRSTARNIKSKSRVQEEPKTINLDRQEILKNPGKLTDYIRISPVREGGKVKGYRVKPGKDKTLFEEAGLKKGDLAVELNGIDLTDTQQTFTLMKEFPTMTDMTLSVERGGQLHELYFSIP